MRKREPRVVLTFHTTAEAMATERTCREQNIEGRLMPAPRALSADCGIAWCSPLSYRETLETLIADSGIEVAGIHTLEC